MTTQDILLPPAFRLVTLREVGDAFAHARANAATEGAGTLVFVGRFDLVEFAVVLEPDEPLQHARRAFYAGMSALMVALAVNAPPEWLVFGAMIRTVSMAEGEAGLRPLSAALEDEGFSGVTANELVEAFSRHFMSAIDTWQDQGFGAVAREYLSRLPAEKGVRRDIDENGDLLVRRMGKTEVERRKLLPVLLEPSWYDPDAKSPRA